jgi:hypothetical protein
MFQFSFSDKINHNKLYGFFNKTNGKRRDRYDVIIMKIDHLAWMCHQAETFSLISW